MRDDSLRAPGERPEQRAGVGWAFVRSTPRGAEIFVDDVATGQRTPARLELSTGEHSLTLSLRGLALARRTILIKENQTVDIHLTLR